MEELSATAALLRDLCLAWGGADPESLPTLWPTPLRVLPTVAVTWRCCARSRPSSPMTRSRRPTSSTRRCPSSRRTRRGTAADVGTLGPAADRRGPDGAGARAVVRGSQAGLRGANEAAVLLAEAVEAGRAGRPKDAADLKRRAERELRDAPWWSRVLSVPVHQAALTDGWGDPVNGLRPTCAPSRPVRTGSWRGSAGTCCVRPASPCAAAGATTRCLLTWAPAASPAGRWTCCCSLPLEPATPTPPTGCTCRRARWSITSRDCWSSWGVEPDRALPVARRRALSGPVRTAAAAPGRPGRRPRCRPAPASRRAGAARPRARRRSPAARRARRTPPSPGGRPPCGRP